MPTLPKVDGEPHTASSKDCAEWREYASLTRRPPGHRCIPAPWTARLTGTDSPSPGSRRRSRNLERSHAAQHSNRRGAPAVATRLAVPPGDRHRVAVRPGVERGAGGRATCRERV